MHVKKSPALSGKDHYQLLYATELERQAEWLRRGAAEKVNSIEILLHRNRIRPGTLIELGCGSGAVIAECRHRELGTRHIGVDYAQEAIDYLRQTSAGIDARCADISDPAFHIEDPFDLLVVSHVLEHLEEPGLFLRSVRNSLGTAHAVIEVPLEDLWAARMKALLRDRTLNRAGHVQFFTIPTFENLVGEHGLRIVDRRTYVPVLDMQTIRLLSEKDGWTWHQRLVKMLTGRILPGLLTPLWQRLYYAHHAVLCVADHPAGP
jgi:trans-aconitate methyltransferase